MTPRPTPTVLRGSWFAEAIDPAGLAKQTLVPPRRTFELQEPDLVDVAAGIEGAEDRAAALDDACARHPALAEHLRVMFVDEGEVEPAPSEWTAPGAWFGPFQLVRRLGRGATAEVWEAVDRRYDAPVALKLFPIANLPPTFDADRVTAEAAAMSRITHDHVVFVREAGKLEAEGAYYLAMALYREPVEGFAEPRVAVDLSRVEPASTAEIVRWGVQIAHALAAAHAVGVHHQDLKPENVLCMPASRSVRLTDFGLAPLARTRHVGHGRHSVRCRDTVRYVAGSPVFMAPEQARGLDHHPDPEADRRWLVAGDVYGAGAILWTLLTGEPPHAPPATLTHHDIVAAAEAPVPRLDEVATRFPVSRRLADVVARAMAPDATDRYDSAAELADDLQRLLDRRPTSLDGPWAPVRATLWVQRHPLRAQTVATAAMLAVGLGLAVHLAGEVRERQAELAQTEARIAAMEGTLKVTSLGLDAAQAQAADAQGALADTRARLDQTTTVLTEREKAAQAAIAAARADAEAQKARGDVAEAFSAASADMLHAAVDKSQEDTLRASTESLRALSAERARDEARAEADAARRRADDAVAQAAAAVKRAEAAEAARATAENARLTAEAARVAAEARLQAQVADEPEPTDVRITPKR